MNILFIEDDDDKREKIVSAVTESVPNVVIDIAKSFNSALRKLVNKSKYDVILLDMSMPNYDIGIDEPSGGTPESYAGKEILMQMKLRGIIIPTIIVTMFESYGEGNNKQSAKELHNDLKDNFPPIYAGMVYYNSAQEGWRGQLTKKLQEIVK